MSRFKKREEAKTYEDLKLELQPAQGRAFMSRATEQLYGGAAGGGKSWLMRAAFIAWAKMIPGLQLGLFRRTHGDLIANHMEGPASFPVMLADMVNAGECEIVKKEIIFPRTGSRISLCHCHLERHRFNYQGREFHVLGIDEATHFTDTIYRFLRGRVRMTGLDLPEHLKSMFPRILLSANPGGVGHLWVKRTFISGHAPMEIYTATEEEGGMRRQFVPAKLSDNLALLKSDPNYKTRLLGLGDPILVRAMLDGDWNIVAGAMFGDAWRWEEHTCEPFSIPVDWKIWRGGDDGFAAQAAVLWFTEDPETGTIYVIDELYKAGMRPEVMAERVKARDQRIMRITPDGEERPNTAPIHGILDAAAFGDTGQQQKITRGQAMNNLGCNWRACQKWPGSRVAGCHHVHRMLGPNPKDPIGKNPDGEMKHRPRLRFFRTCLNAIETIPALPRDPNDIEDVDTDAEDHLYDALRYGLQWKSGGFQKKKVAGI